MLRRFQPYDAECKLMEGDDLLEKLDPVVSIAKKRTAAVAVNAISSDMSFTDALAAAYIQAMADVAFSIEGTKDAEDSRTS